MGFNAEGMKFREVEPRDMGWLREMRNNPAMQAGWNSAVSVQTESQQWEWYATLDSLHQAFVATNSEGVDNIGLLRFRLDPPARRAALTGTDVLPDFQGKGYGKKILRAGAHYVLHDLGYHRVTAEALESNQAALGIILAAGFKPEGVYRDYLWRDGRWWNWHVFSLLEGELR
jgi:RimJ/RimL family protein N-acetyltransferase